MAASTLPPLRRGTAPIGNFMSFLSPFFFFPFLYFFTCCWVSFFTFFFCLFFFAPGVFRTQGRAVFGAGCAHPGQAFPLKVWRRWWM